MGYSIGADDSVPPGPDRPVYGEYRCDGDHGLFPPPVIRIWAPLDEREREMRRLGWRIRVGDHNRVLCPECQRYV